MATESGERYAEEAQGAVAGGGQDGRYAPVHESPVVVEGFDSLLRYCRRVRSEAGRVVEPLEADSLREVVDGLCDKVEGELSPGWADTVLDMVFYMVYTDGVVYECARAVGYCIERGAVERGGDRLFEEMDFFVSDLRDGVFDDDGAEGDVADGDEGWIELTDEEAEELRSASEQLAASFGGVLPLRWIDRCYRMARATPAGAEGDCFSELVRAMRYCAEMRYMPVEDGDERFVEAFRGPLSSAGLERVIQKVAAEFASSTMLVGAEFTEVVLGDLAGRDEGEWRDVLRLAVDGLGSTELLERGVDGGMRDVLRDVVMGSQGTEQALAAFIWRRMVGELEALVGDPALLGLLGGVRGVGVDENMGELVLSVGGGSGDVEEFWRHWSMPVRQGMRLAHPALVRLTVWDSAARAYGDGGEPPVPREV